MLRALPRRLLWPADRQAVQWVVQDPTDQRKTDDATRRRGSIDKFVTSEGVIADPIITSDPAARAWAITFGLKRERELRKRLKDIEQELANHPSDDLALDMFATVHDTAHQLEH